VIQPPRYPLSGVVSWNMNTSCNYRCSYCTQRFVENRRQWAHDLPSFLKAFSSLAGDWEIKLSGGEPFRHPQFLEAVAALASAGLRVSLVTNFSATRDELVEFARLTSENPGLVSASLHPEHVEAQVFLDKVLWFSKVHLGRINVTTVATRQILPALPAIKSLFEEARVTFRLQPEKHDRDVIEYTESERQQLVALGGHNETGRIDPDLFGQPCWAGARYFIVDHLGNAYRCYPARRYRQECLGNLLDGTFRRWLEPAPCRYHYCNCTVPQQRGMVTSPNPRGSHASRR
jgi:organic radical activating enzyme